jgi:phage shock protein PspC (stress-responsive transcriptional regulator)
MKRQYRRLLAYSIAGVAFGAGVVGGITNGFSTEQIVLTVIACVLIVPWLILRLRTILSFSTPHKTPHF